MILAGLIAWVIGGAWIYRRSLAHGDSRSDALIGAAYIGMFFAIAGAVIADLVGS